MGYSKMPNDEEAYRVFAQMDCNSDGNVTFDEFSKFVLAMLRK